MYSPVVSFARLAGPKRLVPITVPIAFKTKSSHMPIFINLAASHESECNVSSHQSSIRILFGVTLHNSRKNEGNDVVYK